MTTTNAYIRPSSKFYGKYEVVRTTSETVVEGLYSTWRKEVIPCHNLSTARSYIEGTREYNIVNRANNARPSNAVPSIECLGFVSPSGQHYAVVQMPDMDIRIDCHNSATLRGWMKDGVGFQALMDAMEDETNIRRPNGWHG